MKLYKIIDFKPKMRYTVCVCFLSLCDLSTKANVLVSNPSWVVSVEIISVMTVWILSGLEVIVNGKSYRRC